MRFLLVEPVFLHIPSYRLVYSNSQNYNEAFSIHQHKPLAVKANIRAGLFDDSSSPKTSLVFNIGRKSCWTEMELANLSRAFIYARKDPITSIDQNVTYF